MTEVVAGLVERVYLEFRDGTSAKFYAVVRIGHEDGSQSVAFNFGRIGFAREWDHRARRVAPKVAAATFAGLVQEKRRKGYREEAWPGSLPVPVDSADALAPPFVSSVQGTLPGPGSPASVADVDLPPGGTVVGIMAVDPAAPPDLWVSFEPVADIARIWHRLSGAHRSTGLWPLVVETRELEDVLMRQQATPPGQVGDILAACWEEASDGVDPDDGDLAPYSRGFPGAAAPTTGAADETAFVSVAQALEGHLGLVAVERPADVVAAIGWQGWANYNADPTEMAAVFRSWEERFGAVLVGLGFDTLTFAVSRPARNLSEAAAIAAEHVAICPDNVFQGAGTLREYAAELVRSRCWTFWWD